MPYLIHKIWYRILQSVDEVNQVEVEYHHMQREHEDIICDNVVGTDHDGVCKKPPFINLWNIRSAVGAILQCKIYFAVHFLAMSQ